MTKNETDIYSAIQEPYKIKDAIFDGVYTKTTHFMLPGLGISPSSTIIRQHFVNAYIDDMGIEQSFKNPVFILLKTSEFGESWKKLEEILKSLSHFVYDYDAGMDGENYLVMFVFEYPAIYSTDYFKFIAGEYSQFSDSYKHLFKREIVNDRGFVVENAIYGVVYKTSTLKKRIEELVGESIDYTGEYWDKMSTEREIYRYNQ